MIKKSRLGIAVGLVMVLGVTGIAYGDGASDNEAFVDGNVKPRKLLKKKFTPVNLFTGVRNQADVDNRQEAINPASELISWGKNVRIFPKAAPRCSAPLPSGAPPEEARARCPRKSFLGRGTAEVAFPQPQGTIDDVIVMVFNGPQVGEVRLHTSSDTLKGASPAVDGKIVRAPGKKYGQALSVPVTPETGSGLITKFNATLNRSTRVARARCAAKRFLWRRTVTYKDGSKETVFKSQRCKRRA